MSGTHEHELTEKTGEEQSGSREEMQLLGLH